jgi:hypothetical protein
LCKKSEHEGIEATERGDDDNTAANRRNPLTRLGANSENGTQADDASEKPAQKLDPEEIKRRIEAIYRAYNPEKLADPSFLESMLNTYKGHEQTLYGQLLALYGPEPGAEGGPPLADAKPAVPSDSPFGTPRPADEGDGSEGKTAML